MIKKSIHLSVENKLCKNVCYCNYYKKINDYSLTIFNFLIFRPGLPVSPSHHLPDNSNSQITIHTWASNGSWGIL